MKKTVWALALGLMMSASVFANGNRQVSTPLPADVPSVTLTLNGQKQVVKPTKVQMKEVDDKHVECTVFSGKDKASVKLPVSFNSAATVILKVAEYASVFGLLTHEQYAQIIAWEASVNVSDL